MRSRARVLQVLLVITAAVVLSRNAVEVLGFINPRSSPATSRSTGVPQAIRLQKPLTARAAEEADDDDGGFLKFLKVEADQALSADEYKQALEQEIEVERKKLYIGGTVKPGNLIVPWKDVDEDELEEAARGKLRKAGIFDPDGDEGIPEEEKGTLDIEIIGGEDVELKWTIGDPGDSIGYIIECKRPQDPNYYEIGTYEDQLTFGQTLSAKSYNGAKYEFVDIAKTPGPYTYRVLQRDNSGEVRVIFTKDVVIPQGQVLTFNFAIAGFGVLFAAALFALSTTGD